MSTTGGPSFLTAEPVEVPAEKPGQLVLPPRDPYREQGEVKPAKQVRAKMPAPEPERARYEPEPDHDIPGMLDPNPPVGDAAGEHLGIWHGKYSAWTHVVLAFILECLVLGALPMTLLSPLLGTAGTAIGLGIGALGAILVFHDRWRCIEAFASKFCSGLMNLSMLYVPFVAFAYANVRGIAKITRRRRR